MLSFLSTLPALGLAALSAFPTLQEPVPTVVPASEVVAASVDVAAELAANAQVLIELAQGDNRSWEHLAEICNRFPNRLSSSVSLNAACDWAEERFRAMGLEARQEEWGTFPVGFDRGPQFGKLVAPEERSLAFVTNAWTAGTLDADGNAVTEEGAIRLEPKELDFDPSDFEGAWVLRRARGDRPAAKDRQALNDKLLAAGVLGELRNGGRNPIVDGRHNISWDDLPQWVSVKLVVDDYDALVELTKQGDEAPRAAFHIDNRFVPGPVPQYNVIADIVGTEFPEEYVIVGGHIDAWDPAEGAQDNATGMATTFEAARLIMASGLKPRRTIRFMFWGGEEQGLFGSRAYAKAHPEVCANTSAVLVHDGGGNYLSGIAGPAALVGDLRLVFGPLEGLNPDMPFEVRENRGLSTRGASDHSSFIAEGVPGFFWEQSGTLDYGHIHHTRFDHLTEVDRAYQEHSAIVVAVGALGLANLDHLLDRTDLIRATPMQSNRRTMGVMLEENLVTGVIEGAQAETLGMQEDDVIIAVDGVEVGSREEVVAELHKGDPQKTVTVLRGESKLEFKFAWGTARTPRAAEPEEAPAPEEEPKEAPEKP